MLKKVLYILQEYPQLSESYIDVEIREVAKSHQVMILALKKGEIPQQNHHPFSLVDSVTKLEQSISEFKPDVVHSHWLISNMIMTCGLIARKYHVPFTLRAHSFDVLGNNSWGAQERDILNSDLCLGILTMPFGVAPILQKGIKPEKLVVVPPVVDAQMFFNQSPNGNAVLCNGACLPKKKHEDFIQLAKMVPEKRFNLYPIGYQVQKIIEVNERQGSPVNIMYPNEHATMPKVYKRHEWLVYTADPQLKSVGWSSAIVEAQAAGVGVCLANIRPDLADYVDGGGFLYDSLEEAKEIIRQPVPESIRAKGFENAKKLDIRNQLHKLTDRWQT